MLWVEMADTAEKQRQGLMFRKKLPTERGMLFKFNYPQKLKFWGLNTFLPLDIAFVSDKGIIKDILNIEPLSKDLVASSCDCVFAVETNRGFFDDNKIKAGDKMIISDDTDEDLRLIIFESISE